MGQSTWGRLWQFCLAFWPEPWLAPSSLLVLTQPSAHPASTPSATQTPSPQQGQQLTYFQEVDSQEDLPTTCFQPPPAYFRPVVTSGIRPQPFASWWTLWTSRNWMRGGSVNIDEKTES